MLETKVVHHGQRVSARSRRIAVAACGLFAASSIMPVIASVAPAAQATRWLGWLDVFLALALVTAAAMLGHEMKGQIEEPALLASYRVFRGLAQVPLLLVVIFLLYGHRLDWTILLVGFGWRTWLFCTMLPSAMAAFRHTGQLTLPQP